MPSEHPHPRRILVLEVEGPFQRRLVSDLEAAGPYVVRPTRTVREALEVLARQPHDLALIPLADSRDVMAELRVVQPDLPLILLADETELAVGETAPETAQALLLRSCVSTDLPLALQQALAVAPQAMAGHGRHLAYSALAFEMATANQLLRELAWPEAIKAALLLDYGHPVAEWGRMDLETMEIVLEQLDDGRLPAAGTGSTSQLQFIELSVEEKRLAHLLYWQPVERPSAGALLLALVALPRTTVADLRYQAGVVAGQLHDLIAGLPTVGHRATSRPATLELPAMTGDGGSKTYALVWRAAVYLSESVQTLIASQVEKLAQANGCLLRHSLVRADLVHFVVTCPPGRNAAWAVHLFKHGLLQKVQNRMAPPAGSGGLESTSIWVRGHYAAETDEPLSEAELNLFLERDR
jgi:CheY-like chemotaxis protein